ncbi:MAG: radical SAM protein, partial [Campylobacterales bacterium]|nr:radical SAM protein [Campylobacterales bacterium]
MCNAKCIFCPYPQIYKQKDLGYMSEEVFYKSLEKAYELGYKKLNFTPTTGELLLHEKWNEFIQATLNDDGTESVYFYSNAILLDHDAVNKIMSLKNIQKTSAIFFSIGGVDKDSYELMYGVNKFDAVCANINALCERLKKAGLELKINCELR